ncbi:MAG TPA: hypothetical protein VEX15_17300 [Nocardioidaceae bacterium]|nr:hypothetical protein [Nocardioidaceae bacterium]
MTTEAMRWPAPPHWHGDVVIEPLTSALVELDTTAYASSPLAIGRHSAGRWPTAGFTVEDNLPLIARHEAEHRAGAAFAHALLSPARDREYGCAYLRPLAPYSERTGTRLVDPPRELAAAAIATWWLIDDVRARPDADSVLAALESWIAAWGAAPVVFRCLPEEDQSIDALRRAGLTPIEAVGQELPYCWFVRS